MRFRLFVVAFAMSVCQSTLCAQTPSPVDNFDAISAALFSQGGNELVQQQALSLALEHLTSEVNGFPQVTTAGSFHSELQEGPAIRPHLLANALSPLFTIRAYSVGSRAVDIGFNFQHVSWSQLDGLNLQTGFVQDFYRPGVGGTDLSRTRTELDLSSDRFTSIVNYGVTDRCDVGVAIPIATVSVGVLQTVRGGFGLAPGTIPSDQLPLLATNTIHTSGSGVGDIVTHVKYVITERHAVGAAIAVEWKAPSGDRRQLLGSGTSSVKVVGVASLAFRRVTVHLNGGRTFNEFTTFTDESHLLPLSFDIVTTSPRDETVYSFAGESALGKLTTVVGEVVGRHVADEGRIYITRDHYQPGASYDYQDSLTTQPFVPLNAVHLSIGVKQRILVWRRVFSHVLLQGGAVATLSSGGLTARLSPIVSVEFGLR